VTEAMVEGDKKNIEEGKDPSKKNNEESSRKGKRAVSDDHQNEELPSSKKARKEVKNFLLAGLMNYLNVLRNHETTHSLLFISPVLRK
jgi:hypothetical protein